MKRSLTFLLALLMFATCMPAFAEGTVLDMSGDYEQSPNTVSVVVSSDVINTVKASIFGANLSWIGGGYGVYNEATRTFDETTVQQIRDSGVTAIRFPGGIEGDYFHWYEAIGPVEERVPQINCFSKDYPTLASETGVRYVVGFGPDEWFELCNLTDTAITLQLNAGNGTPQEAADFVRYCLDSGVAIESVLVGNETYSEGYISVEGVPIRKSGEAYIQFYMETYEALGAETIQELKDRGIPLGCILPYGYMSQKDWDPETVLTALAGKIDVVNIHVAYSPAATNGKKVDAIVKCLMASGDYVEEQVNKLCALLDKIDPDVGVAIHEWGPIGAGAVTNAVPGGVYMASFFQSVLANPQFISASYLPLINHYDSNILVGVLPENALNTGHEAVHWDNVSTYVFRMFSAQIGREVLAVETSGAKQFSSERVGNIPAQHDVDEGDASVYFDPATGEGTLFVLNKSYTENTTFDIQLPFDSIEITSIQELWTKNPSVTNSRQRPNKVAPVSYDDLLCNVEEGCFTITTKPVSLVKIDFKVPVGQ